MTTIDWFLLARDYAQKYGLPFWRSSEVIELMKMIKNGIEAANKFKTIV